MWRRLLISEWREGGGRGCQVSSVEVCGGRELKKVHRCMGRAPSLEPPFRLEVVQRICSLIRVYCFDYISALN